LELIQEAFMHVKSTLIRAALAAGLMAGLSVSAQAQKPAKPAKVAKPEAIKVHEIKTDVDKPKVDVDKPKESKLVYKTKPAHPSHVVPPSHPRKVADPNKVYRTQVRDANKLENRREKRALSLAHRQSGHLLQKIKLTHDQNRQIHAIEKKYDAEYTNLEKTSHNSSVLSSILTSESQERAEIRAVLTPAQQAIFNQNVVSFDNKY